MNIAFFTAVVGKEKKGLFFFFLRSALRVLSWGYSLILSIRNFAYSRGFLHSQSVDVPVLSVGNITLGGTGKTPVVRWIAEFSQQQNLSPALISRGYCGREIQKSLHQTDTALSDSDILSDINSNVFFCSKTSPNTSENSFFDDKKNSLAQKYLQYNDEALVLKTYLPTVPHFQHPRRVLAAQEILRCFPQTDCLILDDAFQHRAIKRNFDIIILDALNPFGLGYVFPRGFLREPLSGLRRANFILLNRAEMLPQEERQKIRKAVFKIAPHCGFAEIRQKPVRLVQFAEQPKKNTNHSCNSSDSVFKKQEYSTPSEESAFPAENKILSLTTWTSFSPPSKFPNTSHSTHLRHKLSPFTSPNSLNSPYPFNSNHQFNSSNSSNIPDSSIFSNHLNNSDNSDDSNNSNSPDNPNSSCFPDSSDLSDKIFGAFCAVGNPSGFRKTLEEFGIEPLFLTAFPDHHAYSEDDFNKLTDLLLKKQNSALICTLKDLVKIRRSNICGIPLLALDINVEFLSGRAEFEQELKKHLF